MKYTILIVLVVIVSCSDLSKQKPIEVIRPHVFICDSSGNHIEIYQFDEEVQEPLIIINGDTIENR